MTANASVSPSLGGSLSAEPALRAPKLALRYAAFGLGALGLAPSAGVFGVVLGWLACANLLLAYAYATNRVGLFGKRSDGRLSRVALLALWPYLALVWGYFGLKLAGLRREPCYARVGPRLYMGRRPRAFELPEGCGLVADLTCEFVETRAVVAACRYRCLPVLNRHVPDARELERLLIELAAFDGVIYVHCGAGRGRSAMLTAALLLLRGEVENIDAAERQLQALRPGIALHPAQRALVTRVCAALLRRDAALRSREACATPKCA